RRRRQRELLPALGQRRRCRPLLRRPGSVGAHRRVVEALAADPQHLRDRRDRCHRLGPPAAAERGARSHVSHLDAFPNSSFSSASRPMVRSASARRRSMSTSPLFWSALSFIASSMASSACSRHRLKLVSLTCSSRQTSLTVLRFVSTANTASRFCAGVNRDRLPIAACPPWSMQPAVHPDQCQGPSGGRTACTSWKATPAPSPLAPVHPSLSKARRPRTTPSEPPTLSRSC